jgi:hypothetical protein
MKVSIFKLEPIEINGKVTISDPCYAPGTWCMAENIDVVPGIYIPLVTVDRVSRRVTALEIVHYLEYEDDNHTTDYSEPLSADIGVDSGQAGFYDSDYFVEHSIHVGKGTHDDWYGDICQLTTMAMADELYGAGTLDASCVVSQSGWGDGGYTCWVSRNEENKIYALKLVY